MRHDTHNIREISRASTHFLSVQAKVHLHLSVVKYAYTNELPGSRGSDFNEDKKIGNMIDPTTRNAAYSQEPTTSTNNASRKAQHSLPTIYNSQPHTNTVSSKPPYSLSTIYKHGRAASVSSDSTDSSPTTTISTFDSPSVTDPSPSSSPESPSNLG
jgi:hypothetical protein